jgi:hypothetical protein
LYNINGAIVQCDDNDAYLLEYHNLTNNTWQSLYDVPIVSVGLGLRTRPNADQTIYQSVRPVVTDGVRFSATSATADMPCRRSSSTARRCPSPHRWAR